MNTYYRLVCQNKANPSCVHFYLPAYSGMDTRTRVAFEKVPADNQYYRLERNLFTGSDPSQPNSSVEWIDDGISVRKAPQP